MTVPSWLAGTWVRTYIRRRPKGEKKLGEPDDTVSVKYIQTPWAFVDVRSKTIDGGNEKPMAFGKFYFSKSFFTPLSFSHIFLSSSAGVTTVSSSEDPPLVKWHACLDMDEASMDCQARWTEAENDNPRHTPDAGYFQNVSAEVKIDHAYHEYDPDRTLLEQWVRIDDGGGKFLAIRNESGEQLLVVAGKHFGYANQRDKIFVAGSVKSCQYGAKENWRIESSSSNLSLTGSQLELAKDKDGKSLWKVLHGSILPLSTVDCLLE